MEELRKMLEITGPDFDEASFKTHLKKLVDSGEFDGGNGILAHALWENHNVSIIKSLIDAGSNPKGFLSESSTALQIAVTMFNIETIRYLIKECGIDPEAISCRSDVGTYTPVEEILSDEAYELVKILVEEFGVDLGKVSGKKGNEEWTAIDKACRNDEILDLFVEKGGDPGAVSYRNGIEERTPIHGAMRDDDFEAVLALIDRGVDSTAFSCKKGDEEWTAIHEVIEVCGRNRGDWWLEALIDKGADLTTPSYKRGDLELTPIYEAARIGALEALKCLVKAGVDPKAFSSHERDYKSTAIDAAAKGGHVEVVRFLIEECGVDPKAVSIKSKHRELTPIQTAAGKGHLKVVKLLMEKGVDPQSVFCKLDEGNKSTFHSGDVDEHDHVLKFLIRSGTILTWPFPLPKISILRNEHQKNANNFMPSDEWLERFPLKDGENLEKRELSRSNKDRDVCGQIDLMLSEINSFSFEDFHKPLFDGGLDTTFAVVLKDQLMVEFFENCENDDPNVKFSRRTMGQIIKLNQKYEEKSLKYKEEHGSETNVRGDVVIGIDENEIVNDEVADENRMKLMKGFVDIVSGLKDGLESFNSHSQRKYTEVSTQTDNVEMGSSSSSSSSGTQGEKRERDGGDESDKAPKRTKPSETISGDKAAEILAGLKTDHQR